MTADIEDLIREAQERQAAQAVHPDRIRAALGPLIRRAARRRRYGTVAMLASAVAVAAVATVVVVPMFAQRDRPGTVTLQPGASNVSTPAVSPAPNPVPLRYRPAFVPAGLKERSRLTSAATATQLVVTRIWTKDALDTHGAEGPRLDLSIRAAQGPTEPQANQGTPADINGTNGFYHPPVAGDDKSYVEWRVPGDLIVSVEQFLLGMGQADLLKVARSVTTDATQSTLPFQIGWTPEGIVLDDGITISGNSATSWQATAGGHASKDGSTTTSGSSGRSLDLAVGTTTTAPAGGDQLTVGNYPARLVTVTRQGPINHEYLVVDIGQGRMVTVHGVVLGNGLKFTQQDLVRVAESITVSPTPDVAWLG